MASRLDRLFALLETGSNAGTRRAAAIQLGEIQKLHTHEFKTLITRILPLFRSLSWETRVAAGQALAAVAENAPSWCPKPAPDEVGSLEDSEVALGKMRFDGFDIERMIAEEVQLLGSEGTEYDCANQGNLDLQAKRAALNEQLGFGGFAGKAFLSEFGNELIEDEDLASQPSSLSGPSGNPNAEALRQLWSSGPSMSVREKNRLKRKLKTGLSRTHSIEEKSADTNSSNCTSKKLRIVEENETSADESPIKTKPSESSGDSTSEQASEWPLAKVLEDFNTDLFHSDWRIRHGAATGVREVVRVDGGNAGKSTGLTENQMRLANWRWLEDTSLRLICVLSKDRFGDFVSGYEVVAPVRESCAQALGAVLRWASQDMVERLSEFLLHLMGQKEWQARHGGLLGVKYLLMVRKDRIEATLPKVFSSILHSLKDPVDDVCAVAAATLEAVVNDFLRLMPNEVPRLLSLLWDGLLEFDELTSWTNSFMSLLSTIVIKSSSEMASLGQKPLSQLLPRLWSFLDHSSERIRSTVLQTVQTLIDSTRNFDGDRCWDDVLSDLMRRLYQRVILEDKSSVHENLFALWKVCLEVSSLSLLSKLFFASSTTWLCLAMQAPSIPIDPAIFGVSSSSDHHVGVRLGTSERGIFLGGSDVVDSATRDMAVIQTRRLATMCLGHFFRTLLSKREVLQTIDKQAVLGESIQSLLQYHLKSKSAVQKFVAALTVKEMRSYPVAVASSMEAVNAVTSSATPFLAACLDENYPYDELAPSITAMHLACTALVQELNVGGLLLDASYLRPVLSLSQCQTLVSKVFEEVSKGHKSPNGTVIALSQKRNEAVAAVREASSEYNRTTTRVKSAVASALVELDYQPSKLAPIVRPLMDTLKSDENNVLQGVAAVTLATLMHRICDTAQPTCEKIVKNLCSYVCCDTSQTPLVDCPLSSICDEALANEEEGLLDVHIGILSLHDGSKVANGRTATNGSRKAVADNEPEAAEAILAQRQGGEIGLSKICRIFGEGLHEKLPQLTTDRVLGPLMSISNSDTSTQIAQNIVYAFHVLDEIVPYVHTTVLDTLVDTLLSCDVLSDGINHSFTAVRHMAARVLATLCLAESTRGQSLDSQKATRFLVEKVVPMLQDGAKVSAKKQGAMETIGCVIDSLGMKVIPLIGVLTVPVMRRMTDQQTSVRLMASQCFGTLVRLLPLASASSGASEMPGWMKQREEDAEFLEQLLDAKKMRECVVPVPIEAQLRSYQQDGLNWLDFLNRYGLHGILCDDMGLGKTLQTICIIACDHYRKAGRKEQNGGSPVISLVICPSTLIGHWAKEVIRFVQREHLRPLAYEGSPAERQRLRKVVKDYSLMVSSYEVVKNDVEFFRSVRWNYCVLDEGHVIRNNKTKTFQSIKQLSCEHRLILSGTPVQNNVQDLWALFDFLMPGLLGTERKFAAKFGKPIDASKDAKATSKEIEEGALAMEALHKQVLPFILRRLKSDVLKDLPPKIIQDYYCELSPLQLRLYEDFAKSKAQREVFNSLLGANGTSPSSGHVFQAFQYLRKVCNHPALVLDNRHPQYAEITRDLQRSNSSLMDINNAAKFMALQQLLLDCGIGVPAGESADDTVVNPHRALIFCQLTTVLNMIEQQLFRIHMPTVSFLKLDGSVPIRERQGIVDRFNADPTIDVLLLTTSIGGLGLNLTGADTVIFVEHDWNPAKDIQAMDRAHRIGQKRVVNVYRLITRGTLEEKIMGLQKFKLHVANSIITQENSALQSMGTEQIVDLFSLDHAGGGEKGTAQSAKKVPANVPGVPKNVRAALENLEELWDSSQYDTEYDINRFMDSLKKT
ncbi:hypothetical protein RvY_08957 [Ramazzottius varieornatus]|uniref:Uncharacterized protein n=1 Tax=Ramazzottius varieornatus TaxID=947166 RepID=A0A1D1VD96_RAMVA|nr:hypothetical protein RvY_08957 [Ramazzottius varieornatus]